MLKFLVYIIIFLLFVAGYAKYLEIRGLYYPDKHIEFTPEQAGLAFEDVYLQTDDKLKINAWFIPHSQAEYTVLFLHGNAGNISHRLEKILMLNKTGVNVFIVDYRGYGRSLGRPGEQGLYLDARSAYQYLVKQRNIAAERIIVYGESLGCAVAIHLGAENRIGALIVEGAFSTGRDMARTIYPFLPTGLFSDSFNSLSRIKRITGPKLFLHAKDDEIVPFALAEKLYTVANGPKRLIELHGGHNDAFLDDRERYVSAVANFIDSLRL